MTRLHLTAGGAPGGSSVFSSGPLHLRGLLLPKPAPISSLANANAITTSKVSAHDFPTDAVAQAVPYQRCALVQDLAKELGIELLFLPSYSPNWNLIERLWKFVKKEVLDGRHPQDFPKFQQAIDGCLADLPTKHQQKLDTLLTHNFQTWNNVSLLNA
jgi:hypothetical protein